MPDPSSMHHRAARGLALALSVSLGALVVINAQSGCDSATSNPPPKDAAPSEPAPTFKPEPKAKADTEPPANEQPNAEPAPNPAPPPAKEPVLMPASKSGGDFGAMHFPGESAPSQQPQQNPAPQQ
ncbi:MAG TPA: hypothetical protein VM869_06465 [Enhygromyxa sp.]|nr:hypothetical protein [Enhygromyxa sp.]